VGRRKRGRWTAYPAGPSSAHSAGPSGEARCGASVGGGERVARLGGRRRQGIQRDAPSAARTRLCFGTPAVQVC